MSSIAPVTVVLVHYGDVAGTHACLRSLEPAPDTVVVDNDSRPEDAIALQQDFPWVRVLSTERNLGFAGGANLGIRDARAAGAEYVVLLNNDCVAAPGFLRPLLEAAEGAPDVGLVTGKVLTMDDPPQVWSAGASVDPLRGLGLNLGRGDPDDGRWDAPAEVRAASLCFALLRLSALDAVGDLDERYFLYLEDTDLSLRLRRAGYRLLYEPRAVVRHRVHGASGGEIEGRTSNVALYFLTRNRALFMRTHFGICARVPFWLHYLASRPIKALWLRCSARPLAARLVWRAFLDGLMGRTGPGVAAPRRPNGEGIA